MFENKLERRTFTVQLQRLIDAFQKKNVTQETLNIYYEKFKNIPDNIFKDAVECYLESEKTFPTIRDLRAIMTNSNKKGGNWNSNLLSCKHDTCRQGTEFYNQEIDGHTYEFIYICRNPNCESAQVYRENTKHPESPYRYFN